MHAHVCFNRAFHQGVVGGLLMFWDGRVVELVGKEEGMLSISCRFKNCVDEIHWVFTKVYGPLNRSNRESFGEELGAIKGL